MRTMPPMRPSWMPLLLMCAGGAAHAQQSRPAETQDGLILRLRHEPAAARGKLEREGRAAVPRLMKVVAEGSSSDCVLALDALANLGSQAAEALPDLLETAADIARENAVHPPGRAKTIEERALEVAEKSGGFFQAFLR